jgi:hypothetical protein
MVWDLRRALLKKEEVESARLADFAFRLSIRTARLAARALGRDEAALVARVAARGEAAVLADDPALAAGWPAWTEAARRALIAERGDPTPHRLG